MAYGDNSRVRNQIDYQGGVATNELENLRRDTLIPQQQEFWNEYLRGRDADTSARGNIFNQYQNFADTGGYNRQDLSNIRNRTLSPLRSVYAGANREVDRSRALQGGYSPGYGVLKARMAREMGQGLSDAAGGAEANIAQMVNQGRQFGTQGVLSAYGATPGLSNMNANNVMQSTGQRLQGEGMQQNLGLGLVNAQQNAAQLPGKFQSAMGNIGSAFDVVGKAAGAVYPWLNTAKSVIPSSQNPMMKNINSGIYGAPSF